MIYLVVMVLVALIGVGTLVWQQRRQQAHMDSVAGFNQALKAISPEAAPVPLRNPSRGARRPAPGRAHPGPSGTQGRAIPLDPKQRAQARRRLEQRRRMEAHKRAASQRAAESRYGS